MREKNKIKYYTNELKYINKLSSELQISEKKNLLDTMKKNDIEIYRELKRYKAGYRQNDYSYNLIFFGINILIIILLNLLFWVL